MFQSQASKTVCTIHRALLFSKARSPLSEKVPLNFILLLKTALQSSAAQTCITSTEAYSRLRVSDVTSEFPCGADRDQGSDQRNLRARGHAWAHVQRALSHRTSTWMTVTEVSSSGPILRQIAVQGTFLLTPAQTIMVESICRLQIALLILRYLSRLPDTSVKGNELTAAPLTATPISI